MATPRVPRNEVVHADARAVMCASYRASGKASSPATRYASGRTRNRSRDRSPAIRPSGPRYRRGERGTSPGTTPSPGTGGEGPKGGGKGRRERGAGVAGTLTPRPP